MDDMNTLLTVRQLQELLQVDRITIYRMLNDGRIRGFKVGGQWRFPRQSIEQWLQEQQTPVQARVSAPDQPVRPSVEALPLSCVQAIQNIFAQALGVAAVTTAVDGALLIPIGNSCRFCNLVLGTDAGRERCVSSWRAAAARPGQTPLLSVCHAGLRYVWGRIEVQSEFVAAIHAGQFVTEPPSSDMGWDERISALAQGTGLNPADLQDALSEVTVLDGQRQQQIPLLVRQVAATFSEISEERLSLLNRLRRIAEITQL